MNAINDNPQESRKEWMQKLFTDYGAKSSQKQNRQFWKHDIHPFLLFSQKIIQQKIDYIHDNPVVAGFVNKPQELRLSSTNEESPVKLDERV